MTDTSTPQGYYERFGLHGSTLTLTIPRSEALAWGHAEPTAEEIAAERDRVGERYAEQVTAWAATKAFLAELEATTFSNLAERILDVHKRTGSDSDPACASCSDYYGRPGAWPCVTASIVFDDAGITVPEELVIETPVLPMPDPDNPRWPFPAGPVTLADLFPAASVNRALFFADNRVTT